MTAGFPFVKCDYVISARNHYAILVLMQIQHPSVWAWMVWLHTASSISPSLLSFAYTPAVQCTISMDCSLWAVQCRKNTSTESLTLIMISYLLWLKQFHGSEWAGSANIVIFFSCHALTFQILTKLTFVFPPALASLFLLKAAFVVYSWLPSFGK